MFYKLLSGLKSLSIETGENAYLEQPRLTTITTLKEHQLKSTITFMFQNPMEIFQNYPQCLFLKVTPKHSSLACTLVPTFPPLCLLFYSQLFKSVILHQAIHTGDPSYWGPYSLFFPLSPLSQSNLSQAHCLILTQYTNDSQTYTLPPQN